MGCVPHSIIMARCSCKLFILVVPGFFVRILQSTRCSFSIVMVVGWVVVYIYVLFFVCVLLRYLCNSSVLLHKYEKRKIEGCRYS